MNIGEKIKAARDRLNWSQDRLASKSGVVKNTIGRIERGENDPQPGTLDALATAMGTTAEELMRGTSPSASSSDGLPPGSDYDPSRAPARKEGIPFLDADVSAGAFVDTEFNRASSKFLPAELYPFPEEYPAAVRARGDSMDPMIKEGDIVIIARRFWRKPQSGDIIVLTRVHHEDHTIKRLEIQSNGQWLLVPRNEDHRPFTINPEEIRAAAVVVGWYRPHYRTLGRPPKRT